MLHAGAEFLTPLTGSSAATLIVFAPLGFLTGVTGAFFKALSITMAATLFASWMLTAFVVPLLAGRSIDFKRWHDPGTDRPVVDADAWACFCAGFSAGPSARHRGPAAAVGLFFYRNVQTGFIPNLDEGGFVLDYLTAPGTSLTETEREVARSKPYSTRGRPAVASFSVRAGAGFGGDLAEPNQGDIIVRLVPLGRRAGVDAVMGRISAAITAHVPGVASIRTS